MARIRLDLFGPPRLARDGEALTVDTRKAVALVAVLALSDGPRSRDALTALLWPELDRARGRAALRRTLSVLKRAVGDDALDIERDRLAVAEDGGLRVDVHAFRSALAEASDLAPEDPAALSALERAVAICQGELLEGFSLRDAAPFDDWLLEQAGALRRELAEALERLVGGLARRGDVGDALRHARRWLELDPLQEDVHRWIMKLLARSGHRSEALQQYRACVRVLDRELGVSPLEPTEALYRAIQRGELTEASQPAATSATPTPDAGAPPTDPAGPAAAADPRPVVGRDAAWAALDEARSAAVQRRFLLALEGEAGVGKTYLAEAFLEHVVATGGAVLSARCYPDELHLPYRPILDVLRTGLARADARERLADVDLRWLSEASRLAPDLAELAPDLPPPTPLDGPAGRSHLIEGVERVLRALLAGTQPGVLFVDDVHWADPATLELLAYLARPERTPGMLVLATLRPGPTDANDRVLRQLGTGEREGWAEHRVLKRWGSGDVAELLALRGAELDPGDVERLFAESEGLPFFVNEFLAARLQRGAWGDLPQGVRELLHSRLGAVGDVERQLLQTAAAIGRSFDFDLLRRASGRSDPEVVAGLERLVVQGLVRDVRGDGVETGDGGAIRFDFGHEKLRTLVYDETHLVRRRLLHGRIADTLLAEGGSTARAVRAGTIGAHLRLAGRDDEAAKLFAEAGHHARGLFANEEAMHHFRTAIALGHPEPALLHAAMGDLHTLSGAYDEAIAEFETAASMVDPEGVGPLEHKLGAVHQRRGAWDTAESHYRAAERLLDGSDERALAQLLADRSLVAHRRDRDDEARSLAERALGRAERSGDAPTLARVRNLLGLLAHRRGDLGASAHELEQSLDLTVDATDPSARIAALNNLALVRAEAGDSGAGLELLEDALALCRRQGDRHREAALLTNRADILHEDGRDDEAMALLKEAASLYARIDDQAQARQPEIWKLVAW